MANVTPIHVGAADLIQAGTVVAGHLDTAAAPPAGAVPAPAAAAPVDVAATEAANAIQTKMSAMSGTLTTKSTELQTTTTAGATALQAQDAANASPLKDLASAIPSGGGGGGPAAAGIQMAGHGFKTDSPPPQPTPGASPVQGVPGTGGVPGAVNRGTPPTMRTAPPTVVGPGAAKPDPSMHDGTKWDLAQDTGKVLTGAGALVGLPELAGAQGILSIGDPPTDEPLKPGSGLKGGLGVVGGVLAIQSGLDDAAHTNIPPYRPDLITEIFGDPQRDD